MSERTAEIYMEHQYSEYLKSPYWKALRRRALHAAHYRCNRCGFRAWPGSEDEWLHVHHLTYERLGCERPEDLEVLCAQCHAAAHGLPPVEIPDTADDPRRRRR